MAIALCVAGCVASMPLTWRLCFPPFPQVRAGALLDDVVPDATYDYGGLV